MDPCKAPQSDSIMATLKKKRSQTSRRPKPEGQAWPDDTTKVSSDENIDGNSSRRMSNLNRCVSRSLRVESVPSDGAADANGPKKFRLKVGGVTRSVHSKSDFNGASSSRSPVKCNQPSDNGQQRRLIHQSNSDEQHSVQMDKKGSFQGVRWKDFSASFGKGKEDAGRASTRNSVEKTSDKSDAVRKSQRVRKRRVEEDFTEDVEDNEIRYLEKLKTAKISGNKDLQAPPPRKTQKGMKSEIAEESGRVIRDTKKSKAGDEDNEEDIHSPDSEHNGGKTKKLKKEVPENKKEMALTTRQRALLSKEDPSSAGGAFQIEFPNGLPTAPTRTRKQKLSEEEQQVKKAEAAQRRKLMNEKAARETEEEAIRKILGQDSSRKKREEKKKKRREELAHEKMATALMLASTTVKIIMGPKGTTVTFPEEMGFPKIFEPNLSGYPPPREVCAGPSCRNPYRYRDSKSRLPLCSLRCYKAIHESMESGEAC